MKSKSELIEISNLLDVKPDYFSFYEFSVNYIFNLKGKNINQSERYFNAIKKIADNPNIKQNFAALGKQSKNASELIKPWGTMILKSNEIRDLNLDELHYVMGYCARRSKIIS